MNLLRKYSPQVHAFARKSFKSLKFPGESLDDIISPSLIHGVHVFHCPDVQFPVATFTYTAHVTVVELSMVTWGCIYLILFHKVDHYYGFGLTYFDEVGIVAKLSECIASRGGNILNADIFVPEKENVFYARSEFVFDPAKWPRMQIDEDFSKLSKMFNAMRSVVRVPKLDPKYKISVFASKQDHCLVDLLHGWQDGRLPVHIAAVISNHDRGPDTHVMRFLERHGIPYHHLDTTKEDKREGDILNLVKDTDFLVLARYMQVFSGSFLRSYGKDIINIHHGLLPSFKGGNPSKQAFEAGVKLIGATSHFVTEELDEGPIIEQMVERVSHRDNLRSLLQKSENLEKQCLSKAIKSYCELRVLPYEKNRTVVF